MCDRGSKTLKEGFRAKWIPKKDLRRQDMTKEREEALTKRLWELYPIQGTDPKAREEFVEILETNQTLRRTFRSKWFCHVLPGGPQGPMEGDHRGNDVY